MFLPVDSAMASAHNGILRVASNPDLQQLFIMSVYLSCYLNERLNEERGYKRGGARPNLPPRKRNDLKMDAFKKLYERDVQYSYYIEHQRGPIRAIASAVHVPILIKEL